LEGDPVRIRGRLSERVPFGTGQAIKAFRLAVEQGKPVRAYDPRLFDGLGLWLAALEAFVARPDVGRLREGIQQVPEPMGSALFDTLSGLGAFEAAEQASAQVSGPQLHRRLMEWNDGFRTLKLIHGLRDAVIPAGSR
jgi:hypothetical protein